MTVPTMLNGGVVAWSPLDFGANLECWWKEAGILTDVDGVHTQEDQSSNGRDLTQSTGSSKPDASGTKNGLTIIRYDGVDDWLENTNFGANIGQPNTMMAVMRFYDLSTTNYFYDGADATNRQVLLHSSAGADIEVFGLNKLDNFHVASTNWNLYTLVFDGASSRFRVNAVETTGTDIGTDPMDSITVGARFNKASDGSIEVAEMVLITGNITVADQTLWESYATDKWAL